MGVYSQLGRLMIFLIGLGAGLLAVAALFLPRASAEPGRFVYRAPLQAAVTSLDPIHAVDTNTQLIVNNSFDGLVTWSYRDGLKPSLATHWDRRWVEDLS